MAVAIAAELTEGKPVHGAAGVACAK
eukprot:COSAG01_NODE_63921_length_278_cov_0.849162_1_plen_25_part_01